MADKLIQQPEKVFYFLSSGGLDRSGPGDAPKNKPRPQIEIDSNIKNQINKRDHPNVDKSLSKWGRGEIKSPPRKSSERDLIFVSKQKWVIIGLLITLFNPFFAGLIYGLALWRESEFKKEGKLIVFLSLIWGAVSLALVSHFGQKFPF